MTDIFFDWLLPLAIVDIAGMLVWEVVDMWCEIKREREST